MTVHAHSIEAYHAESANLSRRAQAVLAYVRRVGPKTDRQIMEALGFSDMNSVRPRITELLRAGLLCQSGETVCSVTGKRVRVVAVREKQRQKAMF